MTKQRNKSQQSNALGPTPNVGALVGAGVGFYMSYNSMSLKQLAANFHMTKPRLRTKRWPRAVCVKCGALRWRSPTRVRKGRTIWCVKRYYHQVCWQIPNLTLGFEILKLPHYKRAAFAKIQLLGQKVL